MLAIQLTIPSKIQSKIANHLLRVSVHGCPFGLRRILAAGDQRLQVCHDKSESIENDPCDNDSFQPAGRFIHRPLVPGDHADN